jgi:hypothetical protein
MSTLLKAFLIARHQQWRVLQVSLIAHKLCVGRTQALVLALVLPAEKAPLPNVGKALALFQDRNVLLKCETVAAVVCRCRGRAMD